MLDALLMWAIVARHIIGPGVQLYPEITASLWPYNWIVTSSHLDRLSMCDLTWILSILDTLWFKSLLDILWFKNLGLSPSRLKALLWHRLKTKMPHMSIGPKDTLCFQNWTTGHDMRQNVGFGHAACLLRSKERSQSLDSLCVKREDKTSVKSHLRFASMCKVVTR